MQRRKPTEGQVTLTGGVYKLRPRYIPKVIRFDNGLAVVVSKVIQGAPQIEREFTLKEAAALAQRTRISPKFFVKKS